MSSEVRVDCYAGHKANERPVTFSLGKKELKVTEIMDQWYGPDHAYFKVLAEDANIYILRYSAAHDRWDVVSFSEGGYRGGISSGVHGKASS